MELVMKERQDMKEIMQKDTFPLNIHLHHISPLPSKKNWCVAFFIMFILANNCNYLWDYDKTDSLMSKWRPLLNLECKSYFFFTWIIKFYWMKIFDCIRIWLIFPHRWFSICTCVWKYMEIRQNNIHIIFELKKIFTLSWH